MVHLPDGGMVVQMFWSVICSLYLFVWNIFERKYKSKRDTLNPNVERSGCICYAWDLNEVDFYMLRVNTITDDQYLLLFRASDKN